MFQKKVKVKLHENSNAGLNDITRYAGNKKSYRTDPDCLLAIVDE
jgi:hypothetical protein